MQDKISLVITSITPPSLPSLQNIVKQCIQHHRPLIIIGDELSPNDFQLEGCDYYSLEQQQNLALSYPKSCPTCSYSRKNIGYLIACIKGSTVIIETDDDNIPDPGFWKLRKRQVIAPLIQKQDWVNIYQYFTEHTIWPRGLPLHKVQDQDPLLANSSITKLDSPIQQGLVNDDPDVDAIYRLTSQLPIGFNENITIGLGKNTWCPFNSQNTWWWKDAFPLMYLPSTCKMRLTDIWRSLVAQRVAWEYGWRLCFYSPTAHQVRNDHDLRNDLNQELDGLFYNDQIRIALESLSLSNDLLDITNNVYACYQQLVEMGLLESFELELLSIWLDDLKNLQK
ncbi:MAG: DUF288 domain-containing protein [Endozoicomonadaceae bacterium]|nr:DUF288 domain-containing protein [Endozoicomonadaceae bacterium]